LKVHTFDSLIPAQLIKRYKRYLADLLTEDGQQVTAHCPNPGRMSSILPDPEKVYLTDLRDRPNAKRKLDFRWELALVKGTFVMVNTQLANQVAEHLLRYNDDLRDQLGMASETDLQKEVTIAHSEGTKTRFDFAFERTTGETVFIEVKQVSLRAEDADGTRWAAFPDAVTTRGQRHLRELTRLKRQGHSTVLLYIVGRDDVDAVRPASEIDPVYAETFYSGLQSGLQVLAARIRAEPGGLYFDGWLPVQETA
jgi:sugar fermentation stimulation protein A